MHLENRPEVSRSIQSRLLGPGRWLSWFGFWLLLTSSAWGQFPGQGPGQSQTQPAAIVGMQPMGTDVQISFFRGAPAPSAGGLDLVIISPLCGEISRSFAPTPADAGSEVISGVVSGALSTLLGCGPQYSAILEDATGAVGEAVAFKVGLICDLSNACEYVLEPGMETSNALLVSGELALAMGQAAGRGDLVGAVSAAQPLLRNEMLSHALALDRRLAAQVTGWSGGCGCHLTGILTGSSALFSGGIHLRAGEHDPVNAFSESLTLKTQLHCFDLGSGNGLASPLSLPGGLSHTIPIFDTCKDSTIAASHFEIIFDGVAKAGGDLGHWTRAFGGLQITFDDGDPSLDIAVAIRDAWDASDQVAEALLVEHTAMGVSSATISLEAEVEVLPPAGPQELVDLGACFGGGLIVQADFPLFDATIRVMTPGNDSPDEGEDPVACRDIDPD